MTESIIIIALIAFVADGIKLFAESKHKKTVPPKTNARQKDLCVVASVFDSSNILNIIEDVHDQCDQMVLVDDKANGFSLVKKIDKTITHPEYVTQVDYKGLPITIITNPQNLGKVASIHKAIDYVTTEHVFICDDDIRLNKATIPPLADGVDAMAFNVIPEKNDNKVLYNLQLHEYTKSMQISKRSHVTCISGCSGLFKTRRIKKLKEKHSGYWQGEDLERTLLELLYGANIVYSQEKIYTYVPDNIVSLSKQRVLGWWGGLYRNIGLFFKVLTKKDQTFFTRFQMLYTIVSLVLDPVKLYFLIVMLAKQMWVELFVLYVIYVLFETYMYYAYKNETQEKPAWWTLLIYPLYGITQLIFRLLSLFYMTIIKKWIALFAIVATLTTATSYAQSDTVISYEHSNHHQYAYLGHKQIYASLTTGLYDQVSLGTYLSNGIQAQISARKVSISPSITYRKWFDDDHVVSIMTRLNYQYKRTETLTKSPNTTVVGIGYTFAGLYQIRLTQEFERNYATTITTNITKPITDWLQVKTVTSANAAGHLFYEGSLNMFSHVHFGYRHHTNFDYTENKLNIIFIRLTTR